MRSAAVVDLDAIRRNVAVLLERCGPAQVMAVVKADAYGHGLVPCSQAAVEGGASWLGVAFLEEALALRRSGLDVPVLAWLFTPAEELAPAVAADVDLGVYTVAELDRVVAAATATGRTARIHLKADTGLSRGGAVADDWPELCTAAVKAQADGGVLVAGVWSHLAWAEEGPGHAVNRAQKARFAEALEVASGAGLHPEVRHLANSAALLTDPDTHYDLVRAGAAVYGLDAAPLAGRPGDLGLRAAMTVRSEVALTKRVPAGTGVSYRHQFVTEHDSALALVPLGYGDGIPRAAGGAAAVQINGRRCPITGVVAMDQFVVDVGDQDVAAGDEVVLFGAGDDGEPTAQEWAEALDTIDYEVVTRIGARVRREYVG